MHEQAGERYRKGIYFTTKAAEFSDITNLWLQRTTGGSATLITSKARMRGEYQLGLRIKKQERTQKTTT